MKLAVFLSLFLIQALLVEALPTLHAQSQKLNAHTLVAQNTADTTSAQSVFEKITPKGYTDILNGIQSWIKKTDKTDSENNILGTEDYKISFTTEKVDLSVANKQLITGSKNQEACIIKFPDQKNTRGATMKALQRIRDTHVTSPIGEDEFKSIETTSKSGGFFFASDNYFVKTIKDKEIIKYIALLNKDTFVQRLEQKSENEPVSTIVPFLWIVDVTCGGKNTLHYTIAKNIEGKDPAFVYDLKGCINGRYTPTFKVDKVVKQDYNPKKAKAPAAAHKGGAMDEKIVFQIDDKGKTTGLKDINFLTEIWGIYQSSLEDGSETTRKFDLNNIEDTQFFVDENLLDYSALLVLKLITDEENETMQKQKQDGENVVQTGDYNALVFKNKNPNNFSPEYYKAKIYLIDYLAEYTYVKKIESMVKESKGKHTTSSVSPKLYRRRYVDLMHVFFVKPVDGTHKSPFLDPLEENRERWKKIASDYAAVIVENYNDQPYSQQVDKKLKNMIKEMPDKMTKGMNFANEFKTNGLNMEFEYLKNQAVVDAADRGASKRR